MEKRALIYCENELGKIDGKITNGLVRKSDYYTIVGVIDSTKSGLDAAEYLDGVYKGIPVFRNIDEAMDKLSEVPEYFIYGIAPLSSFLSSNEKKIFFSAIEKGMGIINGMPEFLTDNEEFIQLASKYNVEIVDIRKPKAKECLHHFSGDIRYVKTPVICVMGTDCAVGKRTTALSIVEGLENQGIKAVFVTTGQTGLIQGSRYGVAIDVLSSGYATGEVEYAIVNAEKIENPDIIVVEGQGALSHPAFISSCAILRGAMPKAVILQHPPKRKNRCDYSDFLMPTLASEIELIKAYSKSSVIAIAINHEEMSDDELEMTVRDYEKEFGLPVTDVLKYGTDKLVHKLIEFFPSLSNLTTHV